MYKSDYKFWVDYHNGKIKRNLSKEELEEIRASDFSMHLLVPSDVLLEFCGGYENMKNIYNNCYNHIYIGEFAQKLQVQPEVVLFKMKYMINEHKKTINKKEDSNCWKSKNKKVLKKKNNIIYVNFK